MAKSVKTFENKMQTLEEIISKLERGEAPLEECISMYEKGVAIAGECMSMLNEAEQKIKIISDIKPEIEDETVNKIGYGAVVAAVVLVAYVLFGIVYSFSVNRIVKNMETKKQNVVAETANINSDIEYVNKNMKEYKDINDEVEDIKNKIEKNEIGKFTTYNVASLLQNIIRIIPKNVRLINIASNDNKKITITASSSEYEDLGYFFAQLKLEGVINNAKINKVNNGETTTIEIGGDMP